LPHPHSHSQSHSHQSLHQHHQPLQQHAAPVPLSIPAAAPAPAPVPGHSASASRDLEDAPGEVDVHPPDWNTIESFQTRLQGLDYTLTQTMSKWAREGDPNQEIPHHEGLGM
jgi:hypothetical protein